MKLFMASALLGLVVLAPACLVPGQNRYILEPRRITFSTDNESMPVWEPGSERIAYRIGGDQFSGGALGLVQSDGTSEMIAAVGPANLLGFLTSPSWVGTLGILLVAEKVTISEYLSFDPGKAPFERTAEDGSDDAFEVKLVVLPAGGPTFGAGDHIRVSRDGSTVAWRVTSGGGCSSTRIRVARYQDLAGQNADEAGQVVVFDDCVPLTDDLFIRGFALSPDGSRLIVSQPVRPATLEERSPPSDLFVYDTTGAEASRSLTTTGASEGWFNEQPDVSPDGRTVAFSRRDSMGSDLYTIEMDGSNLRRITVSGNKGAREPSWSPDGQRIAYASLDREEFPANTNIYVADFITLNDGNEGPFLPPADALALRDALADTDLDRLPEPGYDTPFVVAGEGNRVTFYRADRPDLVWEITCSDPHPVTGRYQECIVVPPDLSELVAGRSHLSRLRRGSSILDVKRHTVSLDGFDAVFRLRSARIVSEISSEDRRETTVTGVDADDDGVAESFQVAGFLSAQAPELEILFPDVTGDGFPDHIGFPIGLGDSYYFLPLSDSNADGVPDSVRYDFDGDGRSDSFFPIFADVVTGPPPGEAELVFNFAQFGKGEGGAVNLGSEVSLFNLDKANPATVSIELRGADGSPLSLSLNGVPISGGAEVEIPAGGLRSWRTDREGEIVAGSAQIRSNRAVAGSILFGGTGGLAGVGISQAHDGGFSAIVESDSSRQVRTGVALRNLEGLPATIQLGLFDSQAVKLAAAQLELPPQGHRALFLDELEWVPVGQAEWDFSDLTGILEARTGGRLAATLLLAFPAELATLPVAPLTVLRHAAPAAGKKRVLQEEPGVEELSQKLYFAQFGDGEQGASIRSQVFLLNLEGSEARVRVLLRQDSGDPLTVDLNGETVAGQLDLVIPPGALRVLETDGLGEIQTGSITVCSDQYLAGTILFSGDVGAAGVGASSLLRKGFWAPMEVQADLGVNTGIAVMNLGSETLALDLLLTDAEGLSLATGSLEIPPLGHRALFLDQVAWSSDPAPPDLADFAGLLRVDAGGQYAAAVIRTSPGLFATLPVVPGLN